MAEVKISELTSATTPLAGTETVPIVQDGATVKVTTQDIADLGGGGGVDWGDITGTLSSQTDLQTALDNKQNYFQQEAIDITSNGNNAYIQQQFSSSSPQNINLLIESVAIGLFKNYKHIFTNFANINNLSLATGSGITALNYNNEYYTGINFPSSGTFTFNIASKVIGSFNTPSTGTINLTNLTLLNSQINVGSATISANSLLACTGVGINGTASYSLTSLESIAGTLQFIGTPNPTFSIASNMPSLRYISVVQTTANNMTSVNLDGVLYISSVNLQPQTGANLFTTFSFADIKDLGGNFTTNTTIGLNQTSVDHILVKLASLDGTGGNSFYGNRTVTVRGAAPSATGLAAKSTLISRGCSVTTS